MDLAHQAPLSMGLSQQDYRSGLPYPPPGDLPNPEIEPKSPESSSLAGGFFTTEPPGKPLLWYGEMLSEGALELNLAAEFIFFLRGLFALDTHFFLKSSLLLFIFIYLAVLGLNPGQEDPLEKEIATHSSILA